ncbi:MAG: hypothetical protein AAB374_01555 [Patescibacteria group bacterium]
MISKILKYNKRQKTNLKRTQEYVLSCLISFFNLGCDHNDVSVGDLATDVKMLKFK